MRSIGGASTFEATASRFRQIRFMLASATRPTGIATAGMRRAGSASRRVLRRARYRLPRTYVRSLGGPMPGTTKARHAEARWPASAGATAAPRGRLRREARAVGGRKLRRCRSRQRSRPSKRRFPKARERKTNRRMVRCAIRWSTMRLSPGSSRFCFSHSCFKRTCLRTPRCFGDERSEAIRLGRGGHGSPASRGCIREPLTISSRRSSRSICCSSPV
jgi:hypothetical protein